MAIGGWVALIGTENLVEPLGAAESDVLGIITVATTAEFFAFAVSAHHDDLPELAVAGVVASADTTQP